MLVSGGEVSHISEMVWTHDAEPVLEKKSTGLKTRHCKDAGLKPGATFKPEEVSRLRCFKLRLKFDGLARAGVVDPDFCGDGLQGEADPERGTEEFCGLGFVAAHERGGEESSHDGANGGDGKSDSVAANHPFAMLGEFAVKRMPERLRERNQEERSEECDGGFFVEAADSFAEGQFQAADSHNGAGGEKDPSGPAMHLRITRAQSAHELERPEDHKKHGGQDMRQ